MATAEDGCFKPVIRPPRLALTSKAAMAGYIYACEFCESRFQSMKFLKEHQTKCKAQATKNDGSSEVFPCEFCHREFTSAAFAKSHKRYCNQNRRSSMCPYCNKQITPEKFKVHKNICSAKNEDVTYTCSFCGHKSINAIDAKSHSDRCRAQKALAYAPRQVLYKCKACGKLFQGKDNFIRHAASCSASRVDKRKAAATPVVPIQPAKMSPRKRLHSIKQNPDGSMVIVLGERDSSNQEDAAKKARLSGASGLENGSVIIDLRGQKILSETRKDKTRLVSDNDHGTAAPHISGEIPSNSGNDTENVATGSPAGMKKSPVRKPQQAFAITSYTDKSLVCKYCMIRFDTSVQLEKHMQFCWMGTERYKLNCTYCGEDCEDRPSRVKHEKSCNKKPAAKKSHSSSKPSDIWNEPLVVPQDTSPEQSEAFPEPNKFAQQLKKAKDAPAVRPVPLSVADVPYSCEYCKVPYENQHLLARHRKSCYLGGERYSLKCTFCSSSFRELRTRMEHEKVCSDRKIRKSGVLEGTASDMASSPSTTKAQQVVAGEAGESDVPSVVHPESISNSEGAGDAGKSVQEQSKSAEGHDPDEKEIVGECCIEVAPTCYERPQPDVSLKRPVLIRCSSQEFSCDICSMGGFKQEASLFMHRNFCTWVSQQKVKILPEKKRNNSIAVSTSSALFNETDEDYSMNLPANPKVEPIADDASDTSEVSYDESFDVYSDEDEGDDSKSHKMLQVDGTADSDDDTKQTVRQRRSSKKGGDMLSPSRKVDRRSLSPRSRSSLSPKSVSSFGSRGSSVERTRGARSGKSGNSGKNPGTNSDKNLGKDTKNIAKEAKDVAIDAKTVTKDIKNVAKDAKNAVKGEIECECGEKFGNKEAHKTHLRNCQSKRSTSYTRVRCKNCRKRMKGSVYANHLKVCQVTCHFCKRQFGNAGALVSHQKFCTEKAKAKKNSNQSSTSNIASAKSKKVEQKGDQKSVSNEKPDPKNDLKCSKCSATFLNAGALGRHKPACTGVYVQSMCTCAFCKRVYKSRKSMLNHQRKCQRKPSVSNAKKNLKCGKCKRTFGNAGALAFHRYSCKGKVEASKTVFQGSAASVVCPKCKKRFGNLGALGAHKKFCIVPKKSHKKVAKPTQDPNQSVGDYECEYCKKKYASVQALAGHIGFCKYSNVAKPKEMPYSCQKCKKGFLSTQLLAVHVKHNMCNKPTSPAKKSLTKANKDNKCSNCHRTFLSPGALGYHFKTCTGKKPVQFKCKYCSVVSKDAKTYAAHVKICKVKKSSPLFVCKNCKRKFANVQSLGAHLKICGKFKSQDGEDSAFKFCCKLCGVKTKTVGGLTYHMVHYCQKGKGGKVAKTGKQSGGKQSPKKDVVLSPSQGLVTCQHCQKKFSNTQALGSHLNYCKVKLGDSKGSKKVKMVKNSSLEFKNDVHVKYVFLCPQCGCKFDNKAQLLEHFVECLNEQSEEVPNQHPEPQPSTSGVSLPKEIEPDEKSEEEEDVQQESSDSTVKNNPKEAERKFFKSRSASKTPQIKFPMEPCKDCDWANLSAKDNDVQCHRKYCINSKHSVATMPKKPDFKSSSVKCEICGLEFKSKDSLSVHFKFCKWVKDRKIIANLPKKEGNNNDTPGPRRKDDHLQARNVMVPEFVSESDENDSVVYKCEYCGRTSNNKAAVINHVRYCVHRPTHFVSPNKEQSTTVIDLSHLSAPV